MSGTSFAVEEATIGGIHAAMLAGELRCSALVEAYLQCIDAFDRDGPKLNTTAACAIRRGPGRPNSIRRLAATGRLSGPLHGIPVLVTAPTAPSPRPSTLTPIPIAGPGIAHMRHPGWMRTPPPSSSASRPAARERVAAWPQPLRSANARPS